MDSKPDPFERDPAPDKLGFWDVYWKVFRGLLWALAVVGLLYIASIIVLAVARTQGYSPPSERDCMNNLQQIELALSSHAQDHDGALPGIDPREGRGLTPEAVSPERATAFVPDYLQDPYLLICPAEEPQPDFGALASEMPFGPFRDHSYWYVGPAQASNEADLVAWLARYELGDASTVSEVPADPSNVPLMIERPKKHDGGPVGGHVLFADGRVVLMRYPGAFPMTEEVVEALRALE